MCKQKAKSNRRLELDTMARLENVIAIMHEDIDNFEKQGEVSKLRHIMEVIETKKPKGHQLVLDLDGNK